jgi:hypothetical protein
MADNVTITPGSGATISTEEVTTLNGGAVTAQQVQRMTPAVITANGTALDVTSTNPLPIRTTSYQYVISTANSSTTQLTAGSTFTGTIETPQDLPSLSILLTSDQPITLTVRQFIDSGGSFAVPDIVYYVRAGEGFVRSLTINGNYVQVTARNTGASTTTTFNLNCAFGVLGDAEGTGTLPVTELPLVLTGQAAQTAVVNNILNPTAGTAGLNVAGFRTASVQVVSTGTAGTFIFEQSNDGTNWRPLPVFNGELVTGVPITAAITATASQILYTFPIRGVFLRLRIATTITGGSIQAFSRLSTEPWTAAAQLVASNTAANLAATVSGTVTANIGTGSLAAGTNLYGDVGLQVRANATGAASKFHLVSAGTTNLTNVKNAAGRLLGWRVVNTNAAWRYVKLHNTAAAPTAGTGVVETIAVPPNGVNTGNIPQGSAFTTGIGLSTVTGAADADTTAVGLNDLIIDLYFA